ncbi:MAG: THUMP domain-containing protein [Candidatus Nanoarchaeia archaeon]
MFVIGIGEVFLKGLNRNTFIKRLIKNILAGTKGYVFFEQNRIFVEEADEKILARVPGISFYAKAVECSFDQINEFALKEIKNEKTFRVSAQRLVKVGKTSEELNKEVGAYILEKKPELKVKLKGPEIEVFIDILKDRAITYSKKIPGMGGLPVGCSGEIFVRVEDEELSTVVTYLIMKRGIIPIASKSLPLLNKFENGFKIQVREEKEEDVVATDETMDNLILKKENKLVIKPLLGYSHKEVKELYKKIKEN